MTMDIMINAYREMYGGEPAYMISAPGRVNLIGEHVDYNGLPVLPAAIPYTITAIAGRRNDSEVRVANIRGDYETGRFELTHDIPRSPGGHWLNYVKAGMQGVSEFLPENPNGCNVLFQGTIPSSAGLSSSSALVVASALTALAVNDVDMDRLELAETMSHAERYVGTQGGGMDQAICLFGKSGNAVKIEFYPLRTTYVPFPDSCRIVVAHSMVTASKTENALLKYNRGPIECRIATAILQDQLAPENKLVRLGDLLTHVPEATTENGWRRIIDEVFPKETYSLDETAGLLGITPDEVADRFLRTRSGTSLPVPTDGFLLRNRALYVFSENDRVEQSCVALRNGEIEAFGRLMNDAHNAADTLYGLSTPELNVLCDIMRNAGASGARLTGAGFGGCCIALVQENAVETVIEAIRDKYYNAYLMSAHPEFGRISVTESILFPIIPADGARVMTLKTGK